MTLLLAVVGVISLAGALGVVACRKAVYSAMSLVTTVASLAVVYLLLNAQFLFAVQLIIYAGAVVVLFVFIIALFNPNREDRPVVDRRLMIGVAGVVLITASMIALARNGITVRDGTFRGAQVGTAALPGECAPEAPTRCHDPYHALSFPAHAVNAPDAGNVQTTGGQLFTTFLLPFEITSLLLLVAAIGAVYLTRRDQPAPERSGGRRRRGRAANERAELPPPATPDALIGSGVEVSSAAGAARAASPNPTAGAPAHPAADPSSTTARSATA